MNNTDPNRLSADFPPVTTAEWEEKILADLKGGDYEKKLIWKTAEGFDVRPYYRAEDLAGLGYLSTPPDTEPFVRGNKTNGNPWRIRQDILPTNPREANRLALEAIARGAGSVGLKTNDVTSHRQLSELLTGIDLETIAVNFTSARSYPLTLEFLIYELHHRTLDGRSVQGSINFDPVSYLLLHGNYYISRENDFEEAEYLLRIAREKVPSFKVITVNGHYFQDAGSTIVQELAFTLASASEYLAGMTDRGMTADEVAPHMQFSLAVGPNYFLEIAKLRAARLLWTRMVRQYGANDPASLRIFLHATTALWNKSVYDPYVNMLRTTTESMSAVLGNADSVTTLPFDITYRTPDEFSRRVARNQQQVLKEEAYLDKIADPAAGSYYIEHLTHSIASHAWQLFLEVEEKGGMGSCILSGFVQDTVEASRNRKAMDVSQRRLVMLGTNQYPNLSEKMLEEIAAREVPAEEETPVRKLRPFRLGAEFEAVRLATENHVKAGNKRPAVFLLTMGNLAMLRARAGFATNFFGCAGYEIIDNAGFPSVAEATDAALASGAEIVVVCSSDEEYAGLVPGIASRLKSAPDAPLLIVAGFPKDSVDAFRAAGVDDFIHVRSNLLETLQKYQQLLGIA